MFDIHCHIIPNVDDGSGNMNDSIEMAQLAADSGVKALAATPHCNVPGMFDNFWSAELENKLALLQGELNKRDIPLTVCRGQEVFLSKNFEEHLKNGRFITLNNSRYMLAELDFRTDEATAVSRLQRLASYGYIPIVAHPERYGFVAENPHAVKRIHSSGCLVQINKGSVMGEFGPYVRRTAEYIMELRQADFVASDAHSQYSRTPYLSDVHERIFEKWSYDYACLVLETNPVKVFSDEDI